jgi:hypothetical protein
MERRFGDAVEAALVLSPQELVDSRPASEFERMAEELVCKAALPNVVAIRIVLSFLPERGEWVRRARLPAGMLDKLMRVYMAEEAVASGLPEEEAEADSQGIIALQEAQDPVRPLRDEAVRQAEDVARVARNFVQGIRGDERRPGWRGSLRDFRGICAGCTGPNAGVCGMGGQPTGHSHHDEVHSG